MILRVRLRIIYGDGVEEQIVVRSPPEEIKIMKSGMILPESARGKVSEFDFASVWSWLSFIESAPASELMAKCLFDLALHETSLAPFSMPKFSHYTKTKMMLGCAAYKQERYDLAYEEIMKAIDAGSGWDWSINQMIKDCAKKTGKPDVTTDPAWTERFHKQLPRY